MVLMVGLAVYVAALEPRTAWEVDRTGQAVDAGIPVPVVEDTNPVEEKHTALEGSHEEGTLAELRGRNADLVGEGSIGESTVAVETSGGLAGEVVVVGSVVAAAAAVGLADFAGEVEREVAVDSELAALTKECRSGERSACKLWSAF